MSDLKEINSTTKKNNHTNQQKPALTYNKNHFASLAGSLKQNLQRRKNVSNLKKLNKDN